MAQLNQRRDLSWDRPTQFVGIYGTKKTNRPLEKLRKRRTGPTLNKTCGQHSMNWFRTRGIQRFQLGQRRHLWRDCTRQWILKKPSAKKTWKAEREARNANTRKNKNAEKALTKKEVRVHNVFILTSAEIWAGIDPFSLLPCRSLWIKRQTDWKCDWEAHMTNTH